MGTKPNSSSIHPSSKDDPPSNLRAFIERSAGGDPPDPHVKAAGAQPYKDEQNKMIDKHNLRK